MNNISVVIICRNEAGIIGKTLESLQGLTDDIVVYDNGSTDDTRQVVSQYNVKLHEGVWEGFGKTKTKANAKAKYDWILSLDADEAIDEELKIVLLKLDLSDPDIVYDIPFKNFFGNTYLKYGEWGRDHHIRLFNRKNVNWNEVPVHEQLKLPTGTKVQKINGAVLHYTAENIKQYEVKLMKYAALNAEKYYQQGKIAGPIKKYLAAFFSFVQNYFFRRGFLDGKAGYQCAILMARYTFEKYRKLECILQEKEKIV